MIFRLKSRFCETVPLEWGLPIARMLVIGALLCFLAPLAVLTSARGLVFAMVPAAAAVALGGYRVVRGQAGAPRALKAAMVLAMLGIIAALLLLGPSPSLS